MMDNFMNWKWQLRNIIKDSNGLSQYVELSDDEKKDIDKISETYKMGIIPYVAELLKFEDIYKQFIPDNSELLYRNMFVCDPLVERENSPVARLVHKFVDRAAIFVSDLCFSYCRHCTRKNTVIKNEGIITEKEIVQIVSYLKKTPQITDVLITGGDPFVLDDELLENVIMQIRAIPHISTIRIGTRAIVAAPMRITDSLTDMLSKYHPLWIHTQFNHPDEITNLTVTACNNILSKGIPINNQSVLLKGINNDFQIMKKLLLDLIKLRIRPYYLYQCDYVQGTHHFMTTVTDGMDIIRDLLGNVPGYAIPRFVVDTSEGKINVEHSSILQYNENEGGLNELSLKAHNGRVILLKI